MTSKSKIPNEKINNYSSKIIEKEKIIRTVKNKKIVYCQGDFNSLNQYPKYLLKEMNSSTININEVEKEEKDFNRNRGQRGSKYRGVSKNGNQWQVLIMINKKKRYIGNMKKKLQVLMILLLFKIMEIKQKLIFIILLNKLIKLKK